jgi:hypothetical protein
MKNYIGESLPIALVSETKLQVIVLLPALQGRQGRPSLPPLMSAVRAVPLGPKAGE